MASSSEPSAKAALSISAQRLAFQISTRSKLPMTTTSFSSSAYCRSFSGSRMRLAVGGQCEHGAQTLHIGVIHGFQLVHYGVPAVVGVHRQTVILSHRHMEGAAQLFTQLSGDEQTALGVDGMRVLTCHVPHLHRLKG